MLSNYCAVGLRAFGGGRFAGDAGLLNPILLAFLYQVLISTVSEALHIGTTRTLLLRFTTKSLHLRFFGIRIGNKLVFYVLVTPINYQQHQYGHQDGQGEEREEDYLFEK